MVVKKEKKMTVLRSIVILIIILFNFNSVIMAMLIEECSDKNYLTGIFQRV